MRSYVDAVNEVLKREGGYVNHPDDTGGATNFGITQRVYSTFKGRSVSSEDVKNMSRAEAVSIYKTQYWDKIQGDKIKSYEVAYVLFDQAVNRGVGASVKSAQKILGLTQDGGMGPMTLAALNAANASNFVSSFLADARSAYAQIAQIGNNATFLKGWLNRVQEMSDYVGVKPSTALGGVAGILLAAFFLILVINSSGRTKTA